MRGDINLNDYNEATFLRLVYALKEFKNLNNTTIILGAGCSLSSTNEDITTSGIFKQCLKEHGVFIEEDIYWEDLYKKFINIVWEGKGKLERKELLKKRFRNMNPTEGHICLRKLIEKGYIHNVITTNFDMLLENTFKGLSYNKRVGCKKYKKIGKNPSFNLLKIHGDLEDGEFRFAPNELNNLPNNLQLDIKDKTKGLVIFIGYRGQDIGLMNSIYRDNEYSVYWVDINKPVTGDAYTTKQIYDFLFLRNSNNNLLSGNEYGDFQNLLKKLNDFLILNKYNNQLFFDEEILSKKWKQTTIIELLLMYKRISILFIEILKLSKKIYIDNNLDNNYEEYLYSYLFFFNSQKLPSKLLKIPNNEMDALILGISIEILVRTKNTTIKSKDFLKLLRDEFLNIENEYILNDNFWNAIEKIIESDNGNINSIRLNFNNKLALESYDISIGEICELIQLVTFLSLTIPVSNEEGTYQTAAIRKVLTQNLLNITTVDDKIRIEFKNIEKHELDEILNYFNSTSEFVFCKSDNNILYKSKWLELFVKKESLILYNHKENISFYEICKKRDFETTKIFLKNLKKDVNHIKLPLDNDIKDFVNSNSVGMFIIGKPGSGKSEAINHFLATSQLHSDMFIITVKAKNIESNYMGLSLFLNFDTNQIDDDNIIVSINEMLQTRNKKLLLILDGLNEINSSIEKQRKHYELLIQLANKIFVNKCKRIKLIISCRENAYKRYSESSEYFINTTYFFGNNSELRLESDGCYHVKKLTNDEKKEFFYNNNIQISQEIINISTRFETPFFVNVLCESLKKKNDINIYNVFDNYISSLLNCISNKDIYFIKKIIFAYFDFIIENKEASYNVTKYMLLNTLSVDDFDVFDHTLNTLYDANILIESNYIKFYHDEIEEFFFKEYIRENSYKGIIFLSNLLFLFDRNVVFQNGLIEYFKSELIDNIEYFKKIIVELFSFDQSIISSILLEILIDTSICNCYLSLLFNNNTNNNMLINIIIFGLDEKLQDYSFEDNNYLKLIKEITRHFPNLLTNEKKGYFYYLESKIYYFNNDYEKSINKSNKALKILNNSYKELRSKINVHLAVIFMEMGKSKESIRILNKEFEPYKKLKTYKKEAIEIAIELGRALNHSGQIERTLEIYDYIYQFKNEIKNKYILSRLYEQKANVLNRKMYRYLKYGLKNIKNISTEDKTEIDHLFFESLNLYDESISLLLKLNAIWSYTGVVPEKINTYLSYSSTIEEIGIHECDKLINETESIFGNFTTPFKTDFYLCKARYHEYLNQHKRTIEAVNIAIENAKSLNNYNKLASCYNYFARYVYKSIVFKKIKSDHYMIMDALKKLDKSIEYYDENTLIEGNTILADDIDLRKKLDSLLKKES